VFSPAVVSLEAAIEIKTENSPCRKAAHKMDEKWYTGAAE
jgi:hypothetical protein